ncbi:hypothetical protein ACOME3_004185 [Neoechinorhynchus agilis]
MSTISIHENGKIDDIKERFCISAKNLRTILTRLLQKDSMPEAEEKLLRQQALVHTVQLRNQKRIAEMMCHASRMETIQQKKKVESLCAQLEKVNYKNLAVLRDISQCLDGHPIPANYDAEVNNHDLNLGSILAEIEIRRNLKNQVDSLRNEISQVAEDEAELEAQMSRLAPLISNVKHSCAALAQEVGPRANVNWALKT